MKPNVVRKKYIKLSDSVVRSMDMSNNGDLIACGFEDGSIQIYDIKNNYKRLYVNGFQNNGQVFDLSFILNDEKIVIACDSGKLLILSVNNLEEHKVIYQHPSYDDYNMKWENNKWFKPYSISVDKTGCLFACGQMGGGKIKVWNAVTGLQTNEFSGQNDHVVQMDFGENIIASASHDNTVGIWNLKDGNEKKIHSPGTYRVQTVSFFMDGALLLTGGGATINSSASGNGSIHIWDTTSYEVIQTLKTISRWTEVIKIHPNGVNFVAGHANNLFSIWNTHDYSQILTDKSKISVVNKIFFTPNGKTMIIGGDSEYIEIWDVFFK